jgi:hypothetical protein
MEESLSLCGCSIVIVGSQYWPIHASKHDIRNAPRRLRLHVWRTIRFFCSAGSHPSASGPQTLVAACKNPRGFAKSDFFLDDDVESWPSAIVFEGKQRFHDRIMSRSRRHILGIKKRELAF